MRERVLVASSWASPIRWMFVSSASAPASSKWLDRSWKVKKGLRDKRDKEVAP